MSPRLLYHYLGRIQQHLFIPRTFQLYILFRKLYILFREFYLLVQFIEFNAKYLIKISKQISNGSWTSPCLLSAKGWDLLVRQVHAKKNFQPLLSLPSLRNELAMKQCVLRFVWKVSIRIQTSHESAWTRPYSFFIQSFPTLMTLQLCNHIENTKMPGMWEVQHNSLSLLCNC